MTDSEKLDLLLNKVGNIEDDISEMKGDISSMKGDISNMKGDISNMKGDISNMKGDIAKLFDNDVRMEGYISALQNGQREIRKEMKRMSDKLDLAYTAALDAWAQSTENRILITK